MDWSYPENATDDAALDVISGRLRTELGTERLTGSRFTYDASEMLEATRHIEEAARSGTRLLVGFQTAVKLADEKDRYNTLADLGVEVIGFGTGKAPSTVEGVRWVELAPDRHAVENQWFLVMLEPEPLAFVGYETSDSAHFGEGGISDRDKTFAGFVSDDPALAAALADHLNGLTQQPSASR